MFPTWFMRLFQSKNFSFLTARRPRWWNKLHANRTAARPRSRRPVLHLQVEGLEDRCLPTTSTVFGYALDIGGAGASAYVNAVATDNSGNVYTTGYFDGTVNFDATHHLTSSGPQNNAFVAKYSSSGALLWADDLGSGSNEVFGQGIAVDALGNVYTTGFFAGTGSFSGTGSGDTLATGSSSYENAYVSKLSASGSYVWADDLGSGSSYAAGFGIAVDASGNVYTTGDFTGTGSFSGNGSGDTLTEGVNYDNAYVSKLSASGNYVWADKLGSVSNNSTTGQGIAVDASGNVYITGSFYGTGSFSGSGSGDTLTAGSANGNAYVSKLSTSGSYVWAIALGSGSNYTYGEGIAVDASDNVYTTGYFYGAGSFSGSGSGDTVTASNGNYNAYVSKLNASGNYVWADDLGSGGNADGARIAVDASDNVYTTGYFQGAGAFSGSGSGDTLTSGNGNDNAYISKLNAAGNFVWDDDLGGGSTNTEGYGIAVDTSNNVYTTGGFQGTGDFSGNQNGSQLLSSVGSVDGFLSRLSQPPAETIFGYALDIGGAGASAIVAAVTTDSSGNVYTAGYFYGTVNFDATHQLTSTGGGNNAFVAKYSSSGVLLWADDLGSGSSSAGGQGIAVDATDNVYTTGFFEGTGSFSGTGSGDTLTSGNGYDNAYVSKLNASGVFVWADDLGSSSSYATGQGIAVDGSGNVCTTGTFEGAGSFSGTGSGDTLTSGNGYDNAYVSKLNASGAFVWADDLGSGSSSAGGQGIAVDASGNVYTTGYFSGTGSFSGGGSGDTLTSGAGDQNAYVSKLTASGAFVWADDLGSGSNGTVGQGIAVDTSGNVYTTGYFGGTGSFSGSGSGDTLTSGVGVQYAYVSKLSTSGNYVWADDLGSSSSYAIGQGIAVDASGNVYTTGYFGGTGSFSGAGSGDTLTSGNGNNNAYVSKLSTSGNYVWADDLGSSSSYAIGQGIAVDASGNVYTTGFFEGTADFSGNQSGSQLRSSVGSGDGFLSKLIQPVLVTTLSDAAVHSGASLRDAVAAAPVGGTVAFQPGLSGAIDLSTVDGGQGTLTLSQNVTILGPSNSAITIEGGRNPNVSTNAQMLVVNSGVTANLDNLVLSNGYASSSDGAAIYNSGILTVTDSTFANNSGAGLPGGSIFSSGTLTVTNSTFANNSASAGAGIANFSGTLTVTDSTFANNSAPLGGGIANVNGTSTVTNSTFASNSASDGGGVANLSGNLTVTNSTFASNSGSEGGGIFNNAGTATLTNTLLAGNTGGDFYGSAAAGSSNNFVDDNSSGLNDGHNGNIIGSGVTDVGLDPNGLENNGGPTQTIALLPGSQAIGAGSSSVLSSFATDQRGVTRNSGSVDIGAYQSFVSVLFSGEIGISSGAMVVPASTSGSGDYFSAIESPNSGFTNFQVESGAFPPGLTLQTNGTVTGPATTSGNYSFIISATDSNGFSGVQQFSWTVIPSVTQSTASLAPNATALTIKGNGFDPIAANNSVILSSGATGYVSAATSTQLTVTLTAVPTAGPLTVIVTSDGFSSDLSETFPGPVVVAEVSPLVSASAAKLPTNATTLTIHGYGFDPNASDNSVILPGATGYVSAATSTQLTVTLTSTPALGTLTAIVTTDGQTSGSAVQVATVVAIGPASTSNSTVSVSPSSFLAGGSTTVTLQAKDSNGFNETTGGLTVTFGLGTGSAGGSFGPVTDNGNGTYVATFTGSIAGTDTITATINSTAVTTAAPTVTVSAGPGTAPTIGTPFSVDFIYGVFGSFTVEILTNAPVPAATTIAASGLPSWASFNPATGVLSGTPTAATTTSFTISASNGVAPNADNTVELIVNPAPLIITADTKSKVYGKANPTLSASYSGFVNGDTTTSLSGTLSLTTTATASSSAGNYNITPSGVSSSNYSITFVNGTLAVNPASLVFSADSKSKVYGQANPTLTGSYSGFVNGDTTASLSGTLSLATAATAGSGAGSYDITPSGVSSANYSIAFVNGALAVTPATLTVSADSQSKVYGQADPTLTASYSGFVNGDTTASLSGTLSLATAATAGSGAGSYNITPSGVSSANYSIAFVNGALTVTQAPLTISGDSKSKVYGQADPTLTASYSGFVNGDTTASLSGTLALSTTATASSSAGAYDITAGGVSSGNYSIAFVNGALTVIPAPLTISGDSKSKVYGQADPTLTVSYSGFVNGDTTAGLSGTLSLATAATANSSAGAYDITPSGVSSGNYSIAFVNGSLTVTPAPLTVTANSESIVNGQPIPTFTASCSGFVNGDTAASLNGNLSLTTTATADSGAGSYPITPSGVSSSNYSITFVNGTLFIMSQKADDVITFGPIPVVPLGVAPFALDAVGGGSSSPVVYTVLLGPGSVSGNILTVTGLGTILIEASQAGDANYTAATPVFQSVTVGKAQTIAFKQPASPVTYGVAPITLSATASSGLPITYSVVSGPGTISGSKLTVTGAGSIVIQASQAGNSTYAAATSVQRTLVVDKANQTIIFKALSAVKYGVNPITLGATASSGLPITYVVVSGPGTVSGNKLTVTGAGSIVIKATQPGNANYNAAAGVSETLTVNKAALTVTASNTTWTAGTAGQTLIGFTITGFVDGDTLAALFGTELALVSCPTVNANDPVAKTYVILVTQGSLVTPANYKLTFKTGALTVH